MRRIVAARFLAAIVAASLVVRPAGRQRRRPPRPRPPLPAAPARRPRAAPPLRPGERCARAPAPRESARRHPVGRAAQRRPRRRRRCVRGRRQRPASRTPSAPSARSRRRASIPAIAAADASRGPDRPDVRHARRPPGRDRQAPGRPGRDAGTSSTDAKTYTFHLRPGIKFSDGSPITADDVKFSIERMKGGEIMKGTLANVTSRHGHRPADGHRHALGAVRRARGHALAAGQRGDPADEGRPEPSPTTSRCRIPCRAPTS